MAEKKRRRVEPEAKVERTEETVTGFLGEPVRRVVERHVHGIVERVRYEERGVVDEPPGIVTLTFAQHDSLNLTAHMVREHCEAILAERGPPPPDNAAHPAALAREVLDWLDFGDGRVKSPPVPVVFVPAGAEALAWAYLQAGRLYGWLEMILEHEEDALRGKAVEQGVARRAAALRKAPPDHERIARWREEFTRPRPDGRSWLDPDGRPTRGAISSIAATLADEFGTSLDRERRFFREHAAEILKRG